MPQIPLYQERSAPTTQTPVREVSGAPMAAIGQAVAGIGKEMFSIGREFAKKEKETLARMNKEESEAQIAQYYADRKLRSNAIHETMATESDPEKVYEMYENWRNEEDVIYNDSKLTKDARHEIGINNKIFYANDKIDANTKYQTARVMKMDRAYVGLESIALNGGTHQLPDGTMLGSEELYEYAVGKRAEIGTIDYEKVPELIDGFGAKIQKKEINKMAQINPTQTIDKINEQIKGEAVTWPDLSLEELKSAKSYAKVELGDRQRNGAESLYDVGSKFNDMTRSEKEAHLTALRNSGAISAKSYAGEMKRAREPEFVDITAQNNIDWIEFSAKIREAGKDKEKQGQILSEIGGAGFPRAMKEQLYGISKDVLDPMSSYNKGRAGYAYDQIDERFGRVLTDDFKWMGLFGDGSTKESFVEKREQIRNKAKYEAQTIMTEWLRTEGAGSSPDEIQKQVNDIMISVEDKYNLKNYKTLLENIEATPDIDPVTEIPDDLGDDYINSLRKNQ